MATNSLEPELNPKPRPPRYDDKPLNEILMDIVSGDKSGFALAVVRNAKEGDASSLKMVQAAFEEALFRQDDKLQISDKQYEEIIRLSYERTRPSTNT